MTYPAKHISISINKPADQVYRFASDPENFPKWVKFVKSIRPDTGNAWLAETDLGHIRIDFAPKNEFGVIDHLVTLPDGSTINNPMRVIENAMGSEFIFTLFWMTGRTEKEFTEDAKLVEADLQQLKQILESK
ncbi:SRPBCC family protein [Chitinophaga sp. NPDC101104]|uniref:SRPBCC family protein n=1 Tax=Chitinophaga sp. NPDC101104 TaxID=3390561 RepID=UPI003CFE6B69